MVKPLQTGYRLVMQEIRNVCLIDPMQLLMVTAFQELGCTVLTLRTGDTVFYDLPAALEEHGFSPDLVVQTETLGNRSVVTGLDKIDCPTIFWAVDPHLNAHWQSAYGRLFDMVCSTQRAWIPKLKEQGVEDVRWLPWYGRVEEPVASPRYDMAFVGRITNQRPARKWMVEFLQDKARGFNLAVEDNLTYVEMIDLYKNSKIIPNESIFGEVNFRLFEAASCGCLVLSQDLGLEQEELFEPGREMDTYTHIVEMDDKLSFYLGNERLVSAMGRAARERVLADHLPINRARTLLEYGRDASSRRAYGVDAERWLALTLAAMWEASLLSLSAKEVLDQLAGVEQSGAVLAAVLRVQANGGMKRLLAANVQAILGSNLFPDSMALNFAGSVAVLRLGALDAAKAFWFRHVRASGLRPGQAVQSPVDLLTLWAKELARSARLLRAGFAFDPIQHLPASGWECLVTIIEEKPDHLPTLRLLETMLRPVMGMEQARVGYLSILTLHERDDWRLALEIGLANLKSFRLKSGMEELILALEIARSHDQERTFFKALGARDPSGLVAKRLD